jgi:predicted ABC-type ATPase
MAPPWLYIVAGPNGAGKTTFARTFLPRFADCRLFVNADNIAQGLAPFAPETVAVRAGRLMLEELHRLAERRVDFGFETTLSGRGYAAWLKNLKEQGYGLRLFFLWLPTVEEALQRVADRVRKGGHDIAEIAVRRRYRRGIRNLFHMYRSLLDYWIAFDNAGSAPATIAYEEYGHLQIVDPEKYVAMVRLSENNEPD